jgi:hypothetical protein
MEVSGLGKAAEEWMRGIWFGAKFGVKLASDEPGVIWNFDAFD